MTGKEKVRNIFNYTLFQRSHLTKNCRLRSEWMGKVVGYRMKNDEQRANIQATSVKVSNV